MTKSGGCGDGVSCPNDRIKETAISEMPRRLAVCAGRIGTFATSR
jgi:hypothetical protein